jgi:hypothetical protein
MREYIKIRRKKDKHQLLLLFFKFFSIYKFTSKLVQGKGFQLQVHITYLFTLIGIRLLFGTIFGVFYLLIQYFFLILDGCYLYFY